MNLSHYLETRYQGLKLRPPLFYQWRRGIRFELGNPSIPGIDRQEYMEHVYDRAIHLFEALHDKDDEMYVVTNAHFADQHNPAKRKLNLYRKYIRTKEPLRTLQHGVIPYVFADENESDDEETHRFSLTCKAADIRYAKWIQAICNRDFKLKPNVKHDVFFINISKGTIFHVYDDRGCDVISVTREALRGLYQGYNEWILDYDRDRIKRRFERQEGDGGDDGGNEEQG